MQAGEQTSNNACILCVFIPRKGSGWWYPVGNQDSYRLRVWLTYLPNCKHIQVLKKVARVGCRKKSLLFAHGNNSGKSSLCKAKKAYPLFIISTFVTPCTKNFQSFLHLSLTCKRLHQYPDTSYHSNNPCEQQCYVWIMCGTMFISIRRVWNTKSEIGWLESSLRKTDFYYDDLLVSHEKD